MTEAADVAALTGQGDTGAAGAMVGAIFSSIDDSIDGWYTREGARRQAYADDPCRYVVDLDHVRGDLQGKLRTLVSAQAVLKAEIAAAVSRALADYGRGAVGGVPSFPSFVVARRVVPAGPALGLAAALGGPVAAGLVEAAWSDYVSAWLPTGSAPRATNAGYQLAQGVYLRGAGPLQSRELQGTQVRAAWNAWRQLAEQDATPPGKPWARSRLAAVEARIPMAAESLRLHDVRRAEAVGDCAAARARDWAMRQAESDRADLSASAARVAALVRAVVPALILGAIVRGMK